MPKKSRRAKARRRARVAKVAQVQTLQPSRVAVAGLESPARVPSKAQDLASRYDYVIPELKRIGIIAGAIILVIIVLSFVLPFLRG